MKRPLVLLALVALVLPGCIVRLKDSGEFGIAQSSEIKVFHRAATTSSESESEISSTLVDKLLEPKPEAEAPADTE